MVNLEINLLGSDYYPYIPTMGSGTSNYLLGSGSRAPYVSPAGLLVQI
jgi:hypothetical protein